MLRPNSSVFDSQAMSGLPWEPQTKNASHGFKKPLEWQPGLADATLAKQNSHKAKRLTLMHQLGLGDEEGLVLESSDDEDQEHGELAALQDDSPMALYGAQEREEADMSLLHETRAKAVAKAGVDQYRQDLVSRASVMRSSELSPATRTTISALLLELQHLKQELAEAAAAVTPNGKHQHSATAGSQQAALLEQYEEDIRELKGRVQRLEQTVSMRDHTISQLKAQIEQHQQQQVQPQPIHTALGSKREPAGVLTVSSAPSAPGTPGTTDTTPTSKPDGFRRHSSSNGSCEASQHVAALEQQVAELQAQLAAYESTLAGKANANLSLTAQLSSIAQQGHHRTQALLASTADQAAHLEMLQAALSHKEARLADAAVEIAELRQAQSRSLDEDSQAAAQQLEAARQQASAAEARAAELDEQLQAVRAQLQQKESEWQSRSSEPSAAGNDSEQLAALKKLMLETSQQHEQRVAELRAEIKHKDQQLLNLRHDSVKATEGLAAIAKQAERSAMVTVRETLHGMQSQLAELHVFRESILEDLLAMQKDMFNDKTMTQMVRLLRDKEMTAHKKVRDQYQNQLAEAQKKAQDTEDQLDLLKHEYEQKFRILQLESQGQVNLYKERWAAEFEKRKKLHNTVLELRGNIRVLCRVRPLLEKEGSGLENGGMPVKPLGQEHIRVTSVDNKADKEYEFDRVFTPQEDQGVVFSEVEALVTSVLDGFNVCIMAYGQTGSGKTHTMEGPEDNPGVNQRALAELFRMAGERAQEFSYTFSASVLEIYNEQIYDLLAGGRDQDGDKLDVKQGPEGMFVPGLKVEDVASMEDVAAVIRRGKTNRSTFATNMNEHSSRSHLVLSVYVTAINKEKGTTMRGKLHLIDLAGSERIGRTGAQGDRLKEAQNINKSLSALGDVIQALQERKAHIPYRNSKLTRLLEDSLGSSSKCVMVVNVSPALENVPETKCSLEFASRARKVELGRARQAVTEPPSPVAARISNSGVAPSPPAPRKETSASRIASLASEALSRFPSRGPARPHSARG